jgi:hypothetical protein
LVIVGSLLYRRRRSHGGLRRHELHRRNESLLAIGFARAKLANAVKP